MEALTEILTRNAQRVALDDLTHIAKLEGVQKFSVSARVRVEDSSGRAYGASGAGLIPVSCVRVRELAGRELKRRVPR